MPQHKTSFYQDGFLAVAFCIHCGKEREALYLEPECEGVEKNTEIDKKYLTTERNKLKS